MIAIIDYGAGNLRSVVNAIGRLGYEAKVTSDPGDLDDASVTVLPGVGAAADTIASLERLGFVDPVRQWIADDRPFLGICIGMQVLLTSTEEGGGHKCLDIVSGQVKRLPGGQKIPHMGWNQVSQVATNPAFDGIPDETNFYFVHSYYVDPDDRSLVAGETDYGVRFCSVLARGNLLATQFHPERSGEVGLRLYKNFFERALAA